MNLFSPRSFEQVVVVQEESLSLDAQTRSLPWIAIQIFNHLLWRVENGLQEKLVLPESKLHVEFIDLLSQAIVCPGSIDHIRYSQISEDAFVDFIKNNNLDQSWKISSVPELLKDWSPSSLFIQKVLNGNFSFSPAKLRCPNSDIEVLLEMRDWRFYSASSLVSERGLYGYRKNKFGKVHNELLILSSFS